MTTADTMLEKALTLARAGATNEDAVGELLELSRGRRVSVVLAHQRILMDLEAEPSDPATTEAAKLLEEVLGRLPLE